MADISARPNRYPPFAWEQRIVGTDFVHDQIPQTVGPVRAAVTHADRRAIYGAGSPLTVIAGGKFDFIDGTGPDALPATGRLIDQWRVIKQIEVSSTAAITISVIVTDEDGLETVISSAAGVNSVFQGGSNTIILAPGQDIGITTAGLAGADICRARITADVFIRKEGY